MSVASFVMVVYICVMGSNRSSADTPADDERSSEGLVDAYLADLIAEVGDPSPDEIAAAEAVARRIRANGSRSTGGC